jgi:hypothetical protein
VTHKHTSGKPDPVLEAVATTMGRLGEATAAAIAAEAGIPYSTTNKKLRALEIASRAEAFKAADTRTKWRLTRTGHAARAETAQPDTQAASEPPPGDNAAPPVTEPAVDAYPGDPTTDFDSDETSAAGHREGAEPASVDDETSRHDNGASGGPDGGQTAADASTPADGEAPRQSRPAGPHAQADGQPGAAGQPPVAGTPPAKTRRGKGSLRDAVLKILRDHPDSQYKVGELCRLIDAANAGSVAAKASAGAVANALDKLVGDGSVNRTAEKPATFQAA